jgi:hypothetical protein
MAISSKGRKFEEPLESNESGERLILGVDRAKPRVHYRLVSAPIHSLDVSLAKWLADGWTPLGGPTIDPRDGTMHQAIIKNV